MKARAVDEPSAAAALVTPGESWQAWLSGRGWSARLGMGFEWVGTDRVRLRVRGESATRTSELELALGESAVVTCASIGLACPGKVVLSAQPFSESDGPGPRPASVGH